MIASAEGSQTPTETLVNERIRRERNNLAPAELRVVEALLANYPIAGLGSVGQLAATSGVSAPTVLRLLTKLGFGGYHEFREQLRSEVAARLFTPVQAYPDSAGSGPGAELSRAEQAFTEVVLTTFRGLSPDAFAAAVTSLTHLEGQVFITGGRFSGVIGQHLTAYLQTLRPGVVGVPAEGGQRARDLLSIDSSSVVVVFDFRRYQPDTVEFALVAKKQGARVLLITDPYLSPLAPEADIVLTTSVAGPPPFDSGVGAIMLCETLVASVAAALGDTARSRLATFEIQSNGVDPDVTAQLRAAGLM